MRKPAGEENGYLASYELSYEPGVLSAVRYRAGEAAETCELVTASEKVTLKIEADREILCADGADLSYLTVTLADEEGRQNLQAVKEVTVEIEGAGTLQGFGSADPATENTYDAHTWKTYDGCLLAAVRSGLEPGKIKVSFSAEGCETKQVMIEVK